MCEARCAGRGAHNRGVHADATYEVFQLSQHRTETRLLGHQQASGGKEGYQE